jgi:hypothetical protein
VTSRVGPFISLSLPVATAGPEWTRWPWGARDTILGARGGGWPACSHGTQGIPQVCDWKTLTFQKGWDRSSAPHRQQNRIAQGQGEVRWDQVHLGDLGCHRYSLTLWRSQTPGSWQYKDGRCPTELGLCSLDVTSVALWWGRDCEWRQSRLGRVLSYLPHVLWSDGDAGPQLSPPGCLFRCPYGGCLLVAGPALEPGLNLLEGDRYAAGLN